ncbi:MAG: DUF1028 domain-containing protein [Chloroflexi bacterium]|nr:DUF1028 domain-containing protein [Chloroflexota bacterium]
MNNTKYSIHDLISTYSIVAYDPDNGQLGVGVQSHYFGVGIIVPWAEYGVGAVATQSFAEYTYGPLGLDLMRAGKSAQHSLDSLLAGDPTREVRQVAMIDKHGKPAVHTGEKCIQAAGHRLGENYSVQANLMEKDTVWDAMAEAFEAAKGDLAERILTSLEAAEAEGGDIRGKQSVAILVVSEDQAGNSGSGPLFKLDVEDNPDPLVEMRRLLNFANAYKHAAKADELLETKPLEKKQLNEAEAEFQKARQLMPVKVNPELVFWHAVTLISTEQIDEALRLFKEVFSIDPAWRDLVPRLVHPELLPDDEATIKKIVSQ